MHAKIPSTRDATNEGVSPRRKKDKIWTDSSMVFLQRKATKKQNTTVQQSLLHGRSLCPHGTLIPRGRESVEGGA